MAYDKQLANRLKAALSHRSDLGEEGMYGGIAFKVNNHKCIGVLNDNLMARVGPENYEEALKRPHAGVMDLLGAPLPGFVVVKPEGLEDEESFKYWVNICTKYADSL